MTSFVMPAVCPYCRKEFEAKTRTRPKKFCSVSCLEKDRHKRHREKRLKRFREYHARNREHNNAVNRAARNRRAGYYREYDRKRWTGERREKHKKEARIREQAERFTEPWVKLIRGAQRRAQAKKVPFSLSMEWGMSTWTGKCALTGIDFFLGQRGNGPKCLSPSIDRIKPELGYVPENCRFIIWAINALKHDGDDSLMYLVAEALVKNRYRSDA